MVSQQNFALMLEANNIAIEKSLRTKAAGTQKHAKSGTSKTGMAVPPPAAQQSVRSPQGSSLQQPSPPQGAPVLQFLPKQEQDKTS